MKNQDKAEEAKKNIMAELKALTIKPFDEVGLNKQCNAINNKKELQFDLSKESFVGIKTRFKEYFE